MKKGFVTGALRNLEDFPEQGDEFDPDLARALCDFGAASYPSSPVVRALFDLRALGIPKQQTRYVHRLIKLMLVRQ